VLAFYLDENVNPAIAKGLRRHGLTVATAAESGRLAAADIDQLNHAAAIQSALVTHDEAMLSFLAQQRLSGKGHPPVIFVRLQKFPVGMTIQKLQGLARSVSFGALMNQVVFL
jgi:predicted nuclease of predicted toxin-antitoxin system